MRKTNFCEAVSKGIDSVILNLFQDPNAFYIRSRNKFGMTRFASILPFETASGFISPAKLPGAAPEHSVSLRDELDWQTNAKRY